MQRVIIIGCPGAGKSTFARQLRDLTGLPLYYLDMLWHRSDKTTISPREFDVGLQKIINTEKWIIDGNYSRTMSARLEACDTVFLMDFPVEICLEGAQSRIGTHREDLPWTENELDEEFKQWILNFPQDSLPTIYELLNQYKGRKDIIIFKSRNDVDEFLRDLNK